MQSRLSATDYAERVDGARAHVLELADAGQLDETTLRRLADLRAVAAFRLLPQPRDPVEHVRSATHSCARISNVWPATIRRGRRAS